MGGAKLLGLAPFLLIASIKEPTSLFFNFLQRKIMFKSLAIFPFILSLDKANL